MAGGFTKVHFHTADKNIDDLKAMGVAGLKQRGTGRRASAGARPRSFDNDEAAARFYLSQVLNLDERPAVRGLTAPEQAGLVPDMHFVASQDIPFTKTRLVQFEQTQKNIPILGSRLVVELNRNRELVSVSGGVANINAVSAIPSLSPKDGLLQIARFADVPPESLEAVDPPKLYYYHNDATETWHLAYLYKKVPAAPKEFIEQASEYKSAGHGFGVSPRLLEPKLNYLIDAYDGTVLTYYSAAPMIDIPSKCRGIDELDCSQEFWGRFDKEKGQFELNDPIRFIKTFDHKLKDIRKNPKSSQPVQNSTNDWVESNRAAISAHVNAMKVYDFYKTVLKRDGIDDKGMDLISIVNCTYSLMGDPPEWHNAIWDPDNHCMWYGQSKDENGKLQSYSRFMDVIAHELTHGINEFTADLIYQDQSGALSESFSDIFGVIINNWYQVGPDSDVRRWNWEIGAGLGENGKPLRDMSNPKRTGDPDHMNDYLDTQRDFGGVHTNSNIPNKAAFLVLTSLDENGQPVFLPHDIAVLYYLCFYRLGCRATFSDVPEALVDIAKSYWAGDNTLNQKIKYIEEAYHGVGIL